MKRLLIGLMLIATSLNSFAGDKGNGGYALVCNNEDGVSAKFWDIYEGKELDRITGYDELNDQPFAVGVRSYLKKLAKFDAELAKEVSKTAEQLIHAALEYENSGKKRTGDIKFSPNFIEDVKDMGNVSYPIHCKVMQAAVRLVKEFAEDPEFKISTTYWNLFNNFHKVALIIHESLYKYFAEKLEDKDSKNVRYFNQKLLSIDFDSFTNIDYLKLAKATKFKTANLNGYIILLDAIENLDSGAVKVSIKGTTTQLVDSSGNRFFTNILIFNNEGLIDSDETRRQNVRDLQFIVLIDGVSDLSIFIDDKEFCSLELDKHYSFPYHNCFFDEAISIGRHKLTIMIKRHSGERPYLQEWQLGSGFKTIISETPMKSVKSKGYKYTSIINVE